MKVTASAPGSLLVTGEHAVVYGHPSLVAAVSERATAEVEALRGDAVEITSALGNLSARLGELTPEGPLRFVVACIQAMSPDAGVRIAISSEINPTLGFGSSAAVTIATLGALARLRGWEGDLHPVGLKIIHAIQGRGSGADLAASLHGGLVRYQIDVAPEVLAPPPVLAVKYAGYKTPTGEVLARVAEAWAGRDVESIYARMAAEAEVAISAARAGDWETVAPSLNAYQELMVEIGVSDAALDAIVAQGQAEAPAAKISGSGLGDCAIAFGAVPEGWTEVRVPDRGLIVDA